MSLRARASAVCVPAALIAIARRTSLENVLGQRMSASVRMTDSSRTSRHVGKVRQQRKSRALNRHVERVFDPSRNEKHSEP
jgi:hypothetical protein